MDPDGLAMLLTPQGWALIASLPPYREETALSLASGLRERGLDPAIVAAALTQSRLRERARAKFGDFAAGMLFTPAGLEQATRLSVAARHAARFSAAGAQRVADLGCGIGGDAMAMAALGLDVLAVERDETTAAVATVNLRHFPTARVRHGDAMALDLAAEHIDAVFADPARRESGGKRIFDPTAYSPSLAALLAVRERVADVGIKVAPGIPYSALPPETHAQWVSVDGAVVEAGLWFGALAPEGPGRSALVLADGWSAVVADGGPADAARTQARVGALGTYLYEPDGAVIRAGLVDKVCTAVDGRLLDASIAYVSAGALVPTPFATAYRVLDTLPFGLKRLRAYLRERGVGRATIKKRGTAVVPEELRRQLDLHGPNEATIVLTRIAGAQVILVVEPA